METDGELRKTSELLHKEHDATEIICFVCYEPYEEWKWKETVLRPCNHEICHTCILDWIRVSKQDRSLGCPYCRQEIKELDFDKDKVEESIDKVEGSDGLTGNSVMLKKVGEASLEAQAQYGTDMGLEPLFVSLLERYPSNEMVASLLHSFIQSGSPINPTIRSSVKESLVRYLHNRDP